MLAAKKYESDFKPVAYHIDENLWPKNTFIQLKPHRFLFSFRCQIKKYERII
jgi:hypothetical protein